MNTRKLYTVAFEIVAIIIAFVMVFTFIPAVAEEPEEIYYNSEQMPVPMAITDETLSFTRKEVLMDTTMSPKTPNYYDRDASLKNGCAAVAGGIIVGYYDRTLENIIPNYSSVIKRGENFIYKQVDPYTQSVMNDLFVRMRVNVVNAGATEDDFKNGLKSYVSDNGYDISYKQYGKGNNINYNAIANSFAKGEPVVLFLTMSNLITNLEIGTNKLTITSKDYNANHILIANGIKRVRYYNGNNIIRTDTYLSVSSGFKSYVNNEYIWLEETLAVNDIVGVEIY